MCNPRGWVSLPRWGHPAPLLSGVGDVLLGAEQGFAGDHDDTFVISSGGIVGQSPVQFIGAVRTDDRETAVTELQNVRTMVARHASTLTGRSPEAADDTDGGEFAVHAGALCLQARNWMKSATGVGS